MSGFRYLVLEKINGHAETVAGTKIVLYEDSGDAVEEAQKYVKQYPQKQFFVAELTYVVRSVEDPVEVIPL